MVCRCQNLAGRPSWEHSEFNSVYFNKSFSAAGVICRTFPRNIGQDELGDLSSILQAEHHLMYLSYVSWKVTYSDIWLWKLKVFSSPLSKLIQLLKGPDEFSLEAVNNNTFALTQCLEDTHFELLKRAEISDWKDDILWLKCLRKKNDTYVLNDIKYKNTELSL